MNQSALDWDNLRILLAIARAGSVRGAAKRLRVSHPTVSRHLGALQQRLGVRLLERDGRRLRPTEAGVDVIEAAERMESEIDRVGLRVAGTDLALRGTVRVALAPSLLRVLAPAVAALAAAYPEIQLEFATSVEVSNLTRREADVVVRLTNAPPETLVGRRVGRFEGMVYATTRLARTHAGDAITEWPWVDWDERYQHYPAARWLAANIPRGAVRATADTETAMVDLVGAGVGIGYLPCVLANALPELVPVQPAPPILGLDIWTLTHPDLHASGRIRAVMGGLADAIHARRDQFAAPPNDRPTSK